MTDAGTFAITDIMILRFRNMNTIAIISAKKLIGRIRAFVYIVKASWD